MKINLMHYRKKIKLTQEQIAEKIGISRMMYNHIETGRRYGTVETWEKLSELFGVPISELRKDETK